MANPSRKVEVRLRKNAVWDKVVAGFNADRPAGTEWGRMKLEGLYRREVKKYREYRREPKKMK